MGDAKIDSADWASTPFRRVSVVEGERVATAEFSVSAGIRLKFVVEMVGVKVVVKAARAVGAEENFGLFDDAAGFASLFFCRTFVDTAGVAAVYQFGRV